MYQTQSDYTKDTPQQVDYWPDRTVQASAEQGVMNI
jgi:hypothetical protein